MPNWDELLGKLSESKTATDLTSSALKAVNVLGEAGVPGARSIMEWVDDKAYSIGSQSPSPTRGDDSIRSATGSPDEFFHHEAGTYSQDGKYTGIHSPQIKGDETDNRGNPVPDLLKMFLGMEENTLPEAEYKPSSWSKGDPEQGWRSIKDLSNLDVRRTDDPIYNSKERGLGELKERMSDKDKYVKEFIDREWGGVGDKVNSMRSAVSRGEYTPDMAVKEESFPGLKFDTQVNVGHLTKSIGYDRDKEQYYMSAADVWDFEPEGYKETWSKNMGMDERNQSRAYTQASLMQASGKSIGLYDRYYLDDSYMDDWYGSLDEGPILTESRSAFEDMESKVMLAMSD